MPDYREALAELDTLEKFNRMGVSLAKDRPGSPYARAVKDEARRRGYRWEGGPGGAYIDVSPEDWDACMKELDKRERRRCTKRLYKQARQTAVPSVKAAWDVMVFVSNEQEIGSLLILDFRRRKDNQMIYEFEGVPKELFQRLFHHDGKMALQNIFRMFTPLNGEEAHDLRDAG